MSISKSNSNDLQNQHPQQQNHQPAPNPPNDLDEMLGPYMGIIEHLVTDPAEREGIINLIKAMVADGNPMGELIKLSGLYDQVAYQLGLLNRARMDGTHAELIMDADQRMWLNIIRADGSVAKPLDHGTHHEVLANMTIAAPSKAPKIPAAFLPVVQGMLPKDNPDLNKMISQSLSTLSRSKTPGADLWQQCGMPVRVAKLLAASEKERLQDGENSIAFSWNAQNQFNLLSYSIEGNVLRTIKTMDVKEATGLLMQVPLDEPNP